MKKLASLILATLTAFTLIFTATACGGESNANEIHVGILQVATHSALDSARLGFKEVVNAWAAENGKTVVYDEENGGLVYDDDNAAFRVVGITAADVVAEMTIDVDEEVSVTYSLAQYIKSTDEDVAKALYSYSLAARAYKAITASEKAAQ